MLFFTKQMWFLHQYALFWNEDHILSFILLITSDVEICSEINSFQFEWSFQAEIQRLHLVSKEQKKTDAVLFRSLKSLVLVVSGMGGNTSKSWKCFLCLYGCRSAKKSCIRNEHAYVDGSIRAFSTTLMACSLHSAPPHHTHIFQII